MSLADSIVGTLAVLLAGYLPGSIPFGIIIARLCGLGDLRSIGSGNIGATNVLRTGHPVAAALTLLADILKGTGIVLIAARVAPEFAFPGESAALIAALGAVLGHIFPVWLRFRGGKGVAVTVGVLLGLDATTALVFAAAWIIIAAATRYSSLAALAAVLVAPLWCLWSGQTPLAILAALLAALVFTAHRANIARLAAGTEHRIGARPRED